MQCSWCLWVGVCAILVADIYVLYQMAQFFAHHQKSIIVELLIHYTLNFASFYCLVIVLSVITYFLSNMASYYKSVDKHGLISIFVYDSILRIRFFANSSCNTSITYGRPASHLQTLWTRILKKVIYVDLFSIIFHMFTHQCTYFA